MEDAAVMLVRGPRKRHKDRKLAAERCCQLKKRPQNQDGCLKRVASSAEERAAVRKWHGKCKATGRCPVMQQWHGEGDTSSGDDWSLPEEGRPAVEVARCKEITIRKDLTWDDMVRRTLRNNGRSGGSVSRNRYT